MKDGVTPRQAELELNAIGARLSEHIRSRTPAGGKSVPITSRYWECARALVLLSAPRAPDRANVANLSRERPRVSGRSPFALHLCQPEPDHAPVWPRFFFALIGACGLFWRGSSISCVRLPQVCRGWMTSASMCRFACSPRGRDRWHAVFALIPALQVTKLNE